jgi:hypothetical protein
MSWRHVIPHDRVTSRKVTGEAAGADAGAAAGWRGTGRAKSRMPAVKAARSRRMALIIGQLRETDG